jgi:hypothetical protein
MVSYAVAKNWTTLTTLNFDNNNHAAYGLHWHHSRDHQNPNKSFDPRKENSEIAKRFGGWLYGRLRAMELSLVRCVDGGGYCVQRRFDRRDCDGELIKVETLKK